MKKEFKEYYFDELEKYRKKKYRKNENEDNK